MNGFGYARAGIMPVQNPFPAAFRSRRAIASSRTQGTTASVLPMSVIVWLALGLMAGFFVSKLANQRREALLLDIVLGMTGAVGGGLLFQKFGMAGAPGVNLDSILASAAAATVVLFIFYAFVRPGIPARDESMHEGIE